MITQPNNTTACVGGTVMFTCVIDTANVNMSTEDISWWRKRRDHKNNLIPDLFMISQHGNNRVGFNKSYTGGNLISVLWINDVRTSDAGPYWLSLMDIENSTIAFLSIVPNGMHNCIHV